MRLVKSGDTTSAVLSNIRKIRNLQTDCRKEDQSLGARSRRKIQQVKR